jgi:hypothetical protein
MRTRDEIAAALEAARETLDRHPERRGDLAEDYALRGEPRPWPVLYLWRGPDISAGEVLRPCRPPVRSAEERLLDRIRGMTGALACLNPIAPRIGLGVGPGTLAASFGIRLDEELGYTPASTRPLADLLADGMPDPAASGFLPQMREDLETALRLTPDWVKIGPPDMQGPFNIAHMALGDDAFLAPLTEPEKFHAFMGIVTDFFLAVSDNLRRWIGSARLPRFPTQYARIAECSVNLVSAEFYEEHLLPFDRRIAEHHGCVAIHPCSGPHVFRATLRNLPNVVYHEAGFIAKAAAGAIGVDEALAEIGDRPIVLAIGQELPEGREEEFIRRDLDRARTNPRLLFGYTGMHWRKSQEPMILELHRRLDEYWERAVRA